MADVEESSRMRKFRKILASLKKHVLVILVVAGIFLGVVIGISLRSLNLSPNNKEYIGFLGDILNQALKSVAVPIMLGAIITHIGNLHVKYSGKIFFRILIYLLVSKSCAAVICIPLCVFVGPGTTHSEPTINQDLNIIFEKNTSGRAVDKFLDIGRNILPENWIEMFNYHYETTIVKTMEEQDKDYEVVMKDGPNLLGIVVVSFLIGVALSQMGDEGTPLTSTFDCLTKVSMIVTKWFIWIAPVGVMFIICRDILKADNILFVNFKILAKFLALLWTCCIVQLLVIHPIIYFLCTRKNPYLIFVNCKESLLISMATASGYGSMPIAIKELLENQKVDERVVNTVLPIGVTINKDGAFYLYVIGCFFEAQRINRPIGVDLILFVLILALTTSMATAAVPNEGLILLFMMWSTLNLKVPNRDIELLFIADFIGDRLRTVVNVYGNIFCVSVLDHFNLFDDDERLP